MGEKDNFMLEARHCVTVGLKKKIRFGFRCNAFSILTVHNFCNCAVPSRKFASAEKIVEINF